MDGSFSVITSRRLSPIRIATKLTAIGSPPPIWPYERPRNDDATPSRASVVANPNANAAALPSHQQYQETRFCKKNLKQALGKTVTTNRLCLTAMLCSSCT